MAGYQLIINAEIFRGRYRKSFEHPEAIPANEPLEYRFSLHAADHTFLKGHRIKVQVQSTWFPLYDRNPQKFLPNIMTASRRRFFQGHPTHLSRVSPHPAARPMTPYPTHTIPIPSNYERASCTGAKSS